MTHSSITSLCTWVSAYPSVMLLLVSAASTVSALPTAVLSTPLFRREVPPGSSNPSICSNLNSVQDEWIAINLASTNNVAFLRNKNLVTVGGRSDGITGYPGLGKCVVSVVDGKTLIGYASTHSAIGMFTFDPTKDDLTETKMFGGKRQQQASTPSQMAIGYLRNGALTFYAYDDGKRQIRVGGASAGIPFSPAPGSIIDMAVDAQGNLWILNTNGTLHLFSPNDPTKSGTAGSWVGAPPPINTPIHVLPHNDSVAIVSKNATVYSAQIATISTETLPDSISLSPATTIALATASTTDTPIFGFVNASVVALSKTNLLPVPSSPQPPGSDVPQYGNPPPQPPQQPSPSQGGGFPIGAIIGIVVGVCLALIAVMFVLRRRQRRQGGQVRGKKKSSLFASQNKKARDLFPPSQRDDMATAPLGIYTDHHTDRSRSAGVADYPMNAMSTGGALGMQQEDRGSYVSGGSADTCNYHMEDQIPFAARMHHQEYGQTAHHQLPYAVSISSMAPQFARTNAQSGLRFEEKVQLQVIRYEDADASLTRPHLPVGSLVLGAYHILRPPRSARPLKVLKDDASGQALGIVRSGTVFVRKSRNGGQGDLSTTQTLAPTSLMNMQQGEDSSMLLTDVENQHTSETHVLKWYMTEVHWKREAALLKHLKSPIFIMELVASYCIPTLQYRPNAYPFVNALGGCSRLLSELGPVRSPQHARSILRSVSAAIDWCHQRGVVHLNIQPASFFIEDSIDPDVDDASWKLWDFTCARFIGEQIGVIGGGGNADAFGKRTSQLPPIDGGGGGRPSQPFGDQRLYEEQQQLISGNPLPACYTAPELLEAWRSEQTALLAEASMDSWSLGCLYYEIMTGHSLFRTEADAWALIGGWENSGPRRLDDFRVPFPTTTATAAVRSRSPSPTPGESDLSSALDPTGTIGHLMRDLLVAHPAKRLTLAMTMERIY